MVEIIKIMIFVRFPAQVPAISALGQRKRQRTRALSLLAKLILGPGGENCDNAIHESNDDNLLHAKRVYQ